MGESRDRETRDPYLSMKCKSREQCSSSQTEEHVQSPMS